VLVYDDWSLLWGFQFYAGNSGLEQFEFEEVLRQGFDIDGRYSSFRLCDNDKRMGSLWHSNQFCSR
ncbi:hypothetical protein, partial [Pseudomonas chlororaphis]|uniref:hypothetical protein n=1 Tax=Pseudomonas chlororaphis TaxID=587753 RepID=UPI001B32AE2F